MLEVFDETTAVSAVRRVDFGAQVDQFGWAQSIRPTDNSNVRISLGFVCLSVCLTVFVCFSKLTKSPVFSSAPNKRAQVCFPARFASHSSHGRPSGVPEIQFKRNAHLLQWHANRARRMPASFRRPPQEAKASRARALSDLRPFKLPSSHLFAWPTREEKLLFIHFGREILANGNYFFLLGWCTSIKMIKRAGKCYPFHLSNPSLLLLLSPFVLRLAPGGS